MTELIRKPTNRQPSLADYLTDPERYPTVSGRPYPNANPMGAVGQSPDLASLFAAPEENALGPPSVTPGIHDVHTNGTAFRALALPPGTVPPTPVPPMPLPERRGLEPESAPEAPQAGDLDAQWAAALSRARIAGMRDNNFGLQSQAGFWAQRGPRPEAPQPPQPSPVMTALLHNPVARYIRSQSDPMAVAPQLREADARYATRVPIPAGGKPSGAHQLIPHKDLAIQQQARQRTDREGVRDDPFRFERDPFTGEIVLETAEERRIREEQARADQERVDRQQGLRFSERGRLEYRRRF